MGTILYISGIITALSVVAAFLYRSRYDYQQKIIKNLTEEISELREYKEEKESKKRKGMLVSKGWYRVKDEEDPNKYTWDVSFELKEIAQSPSNEHKIQFKVVGIYSESQSEQPMSDKTYEHYEAWFLGNYAGGWVDTKSKDFEWIDTTSKTEMRDDKLDQLGIK